MGIYSKGAKYLMRLHDLIILTERSHIPAPWNPAQLDPALMALDEYAQYCNRRDMWHPSGAYDCSIDDLNSKWQVSKSDYKLVRRFKIHGLDFELMLRSVKNRYCVPNPDPYERGDEPHLRINGELVYYTDEEIARLGMRPLEFIIAVFHGDLRAASSTDEWGCMLVQVAREYRGFGLGTILGKFARTLEPAKDSGGFTHAGLGNFTSVHREFVRDALRNGLYSKLLRQGTLTMERVREIVESAKLHMTNQKRSLDLSTNNPDDWLLFSDNHGTFILYDRKLSDILGKDIAEKHVEAMIKGYVYALHDGEVTRIKQFGGEGEKLRAFMLALAYTTAEVNRSTLWVEPEEYDLAGFQYGDEENVVGFRSRPVTHGHLIDYIAMAEREKRWRKARDPHQEFEHEMHELAVSKYQG